MKNKLIILSLMVLLVASGAFAQVTFSGQIQMEQGSGLSGSAETGKAPKNDYGISDADIQLQANIKADDFNTGTIRMRWRTDKAANTTGSSPAIGIDRAFLSSDIGKAFGLPIGWVSQVGMDYWLMRPKASDAYMILLRPLARSGGYGTTTNGQNYNLRFFDDPQWGTKQVLTFADGLFTLSGYFSFMGTDPKLQTSGSYLTNNTNQNGTSPRLRNFWVEANIAAPAGPGTFNLALAYLVDSGSQRATLTRGPGFGVKAIADDKIKNDSGAFGYGQGYFQFAPSYLGLKDVVPGAKLDFGLSYWRAMDQAFGVDMLALNIQANFDGNKGYALVGFQGYPVENKDFFGDPDATVPSGNKSDYKAQIIHNVRLAGGYKLVDNFGLDLGVILYTGGKDTYALSMKDATDTDEKKRGVLNSLDFSAALYVGKTEFRLGYLFVPKEDTSIQPLHNLAGGQDMTRSCLYLISTLRF